MKSKYKRKLSWLWVIPAFIGINLLAAFFHIRLDLTDEQRFTISTPVQTMLENLKSETTVYVFLRGDMPAGFKMLSQSTEELLQEFKEYAGGRLDYEFVSTDNPVPGTNIPWADTLIAKGAVPINLKIQLEKGEQSQFIYPAAMVVSDGNMVVANLYQGNKPFISAPELNSAEALLEYRIADAIQQVHTNDRPLIAYAIGNGEPTGIHTYDLVENVLSKAYKVFTVNLQTEPNIPDTFDLLLIVKPEKPFTDAEKLKIDQYVMRGGKLLAFIDRLEAEADSLQLKNQVIAYDRNLHLNDLFFNYGVRINPDLIMDLQSDFLPFMVNTSKQYQMLHWNYYPLFESPQTHIINKNVGLVAGRFVNSMDTVQAEGIHQTVLLNSSPNSRTIGTPALISGTENRNAPVDEDFRQNDIMAGVLLEGKFTSLYNNRISRETMDSLLARGTPYVAENIQPNKMIIISDGDIPLNQTYQSQPLPMGVNQYTVGTQYEYQFANREFVANSIEYLVNEGGLMEAKAKDYQLRLLDPKKTEAQRGKWQILNLALPLVFIVLFGLIYQWWRKRRYSV